MTDRKFTPIRIAIEILIRTILLVWMLLILFWTVLQFEAVQTYLGRQATTFLSQELDAKVEVERLKLRLLKYIRFEGFYLEDQEEDTLVYLKGLDLDLMNFSFSEKQFELSAVLDQPKLNLYRNEEDSTFNYQFLIDRFSSDSSSNDQFVFKAKYLEIKGGSFIYQDNHYPRLDKGIDYKHLNVSHLDLVANDVRFEGQFIDAGVEALSLKMKDGFKLNQLSTNFKMEPELLSFQDLSVETYTTELTADISFRANSFKSYANFTEEVFISADFDNSLIQLKDLAYFVPAMNSTSHQLLLDGSVSGTVSNLSSDNFELHINKDSYLVGEFDIRGLPNIEETFIFFKASDLRTNARGLRSLPIETFSSDFKLNIPKEVDRLGEIQFTGNFTGYLSDFVAYGKFTTDLGRFGSDLSLRQENDQAYYKGSLTANRFGLGELMALKDLGEISFNLEIDGKGLKLNTMEAKANGQISLLHYRDYQYHEIDLDGKFSAAKFNGSLKVEDENLRMIFDGDIDASSDTLFSNFELKLDEAKLARLNLFQKEDSLTSLSLMAKIDLEGSNLDNFMGSVILDSIHYRDANQEYYSNELRLYAGGQSNKRELKFQSEFFDAELKGQFKLGELDELLLNDIKEQVPNEIVAEEEEANQKFQYQIDIKNIRPISALFIPALSIDSASKIVGSFNNLRNNHRLSFHSSRFAYDRFVLDSLELKGSSDSSGFGLDLISNSFSISRNVDLSNFTMNATLGNGEGKLIMDWKGINQSLENGIINLQANIRSFDDLDARFIDSKFLLNDSLWQFGNQNQISLRKDTIEIDSLKLGNEKQRVLLNGRISRNEEDSLLLDLRNFNLAYLSSFIGSESLTMSGTINGNVNVRDAYQKILLTSNLKAEQLIVNQIEIGEASLDSYWLKDSTGIKVSAYLGPRSNKLLNLSGTVQPKKVLDELDLVLSLNKFPVKLTEPFISDVLSELKGDLNGKIKIKGSREKPLLKGDLHLANAGTRVNYLNTYYELDHTILIREDFIGFDLMKIKDEYGSFATATGTIFHDNYSKFNLDIGLEMENFTGLNTAKKDNELFYGKAVVSGWSNISGFADQLIFEMNLTAKEGTDFKIPLDDDVTVSENDFLVFTNSPSFEEDSTIKIDLSGITLNFDLTIEPEAKTTIIFDESIGDVIKAQGNGNLKLEISTAGNFNMFGQYTLEEGEYLFTLRKIVNKRFKLEPGSRMMWDGDPYKARLDIRAIYNLRASLYDIMPEDSTGRYRRRVPVELILGLGGYLLNPEITFDINVPGADETVKNRLESILYVNQNNVNEQELNQQVFGLLVLGRFMPPSTGVSRNTASRSAGGAYSGYELLTNQLSNWLSSVSNEFDVGVSYRPADEVSDEEIDLSLSTEILNDRLILDGNLGYSSNNQQVNNNNQANFIGEFMLEYKLKRDGRLRIRGFNRSTNNNLLQINSPYTQGVGLFYREEFDNFSEIWRKYFGKDKEKNKAVKDNNS